MSKDMEQYVKSCDTCQRVKDRTTKVPGLLHQLAIPERPGQSIAMDFLNLKCRAYDPISKQYFDSLYVITDRLTRISVLIPCTTTITAKDVAQLFLAHWYKRFGTPDEIISDRDSKFTSEIWTAACKELGITRKLSSAYHPQTDGATERVNRTILQMLRAELNRKPQHDWVKKIPEVEFNYNARYHASIGMAPFQAAYGYIPNYGDYQITSSDKRPLEDRIDEAIKTAKRKRTTIAEQANKRRKPAQKYQLNDYVLIDTRDIRANDAQLNISKKLQSRYQGPYPITEILRGETYRVKLLERSKMHNAFHTSLLRPYIFSVKGKYPKQDKTPLRPGPIDPEEPDTFEVEKILTHDMKGRAPHQVRFKVLWQGYPSTEATWEPGHIINEDAPERVEKYLRKLTSLQRQQVEKKL